MLSEDYLFANACANACTNVFRLTVQIIETIKMVDTYMRLWNLVSVTPATFLVQLKYSDAWSPPFALLRML